MERRQTSPRFLDTHLVDIHEVLPEEEEEEEGNAKEENEKAEKRFNKQVKVREMKRDGQRKLINRQLSLETGFSVLKKESNKAKDENRAVNLPRSGRSFNGFDSINRVGMEGRKGDFSIFKTKSSNLSKQNSLLPSRKERSEMESQNNTDGVGEESVDTSVPAGRYFAALRGPELDQVKDDEDILLPKDEKWPFLLRFPIGCFGICLGLSSQAVLWHALATSPATKFLHVPLFINLALWLLAVAILFCISFTYILKIIFYFEAIKREYFHPVRVNFFFAPWVVCMFLALAAPPSLFPNKLQPAIWCIFMLPYFLLEVKIYGQWLSGGKRRLCKVANPSSHLSVVGNFVGAILAAKVGWVEPAKFLWAVGFAHYFVVFVTLYQRLPTSEALPRDLHPVYSMFIAAPSAASIAWQNIYGHFDEVSRNCYFIALFLYVSLVVRIKFFTGFRFSVAWWSYTFPMTTFAVATIKYAEEVPSVQNPCSFASPAVPRFLNTMENAETAETETKPFKILLSCPSGLSPSQVSVVFDELYDRVAHPDINLERSISEIWDQRVQKNPSLYNGTKFRYGHHIWHDEGGANQESHVCLHLGLTDYRTFVGTNLNPLWEKFLVSSEDDAIRCQHTSSPLGNGAIVETSDKNILVLQRSHNVGEFPGHFVFPGGHPEPQEVGIVSHHHKDLTDFKLLNKKASQEMFDSIAREVVEEIGVPSDSLYEQVFIGISRRELNVRPAAFFFMKCSLSSKEIQQLYSTAQDSFESTQLYTVPMIELENMAYKMPGCHEGGFALYKLMVESGKNV